jgi:hypothetical protein
MFQLTEHTKEEGEGGLLKNAWGKLGSGNSNPNFLDILAALTVGKMAMT